MAIGTAHADFTATYTRLADSPLGVGTAWYSGAVTNDGKFIYGLGNGHDTTANNSLWLFDPVTNTHKNLFPNTGNKWKWVTDPATGKPVAQSGYWAKLDPVADKTLYTFFGGPDIYGLNNRNNHQAFYLPARNEFWIVAGANWDHGGNLWGGRFNLATSRYNNVSKSPTEFFAGMIAGSAGWVAANAATAVCKDLNTVVMFGGMGDRTGGVRMIEPNPTGPEPYKGTWAPKPPIYMPAENVRHSAVCVGDTVYFSTGQERWPNESKPHTPNPGPFWKFHVPSRAWTRLTDGPPGGYFPTLTYDSDHQALLYYGGGTGTGSDALWVYDLTQGTWQNLTGTVPNLPRVAHHTGGFVPGFGHVFKGGWQFDATGKQMGYGASARMMVVRLTPGERPRPALTVSSAPSSAMPTQNANAVDERADMPAEPDIGKAPDRRERSGAWRDGHPPTSSTLAAIRRGDSMTVANQTADAPTAKVSRRARQADKGRRPGGLATPQADAQSPPQMGGRLVWTQIPLPGSPNSPQGGMKHQRLAEGPNGRVYILGGDWGGAGGENTGRQEVYSFDPLVATGGWKLEAPYCGTVTSPVHWHTDEAGVAWDAKRNVFWKLAGTPYGPDDACFLAGRSVKAKAIQFDPAKREWIKPAGFDQKNIGYVTNGVLDPVKDEMIQITDKAAWHLNLTTGQWTSHPLPGTVLRFNALSTRLGRNVWWVNRSEALESYNLDTHALVSHGQWPFPQIDGWSMMMTFAWGDKVLVVKPTTGPAETRQMALYDPALKKWTVLNQGDGWGNTGTVTSDNKLILMGGGINGPEYYNKHVWIGSVR